MAKAKNEEKLLVATKEQKAEAAKIFEDNKLIKVLFLNGKGEFFTSSNLAANSVKNAVTDLVEITRSEAGDANEVTEE